MDIIYMIWFVPLFLFLFALFYFVVMRKNDFEKRLAIFYPYRQLSQKREAYMQKVSKYSYIIFALFLLPFFFLVYILFKENYQEISEANTSFSDENLMLILATLLPLFVCYYIIFYMQKRSRKASLRPAAGAPLRGTGISRRGERGSGLLNPGQHQFCRVPHLH